MIQKKSLKDAIQNPEIISVVGGLLNIDGYAKIYTISNGDPTKDRVKLFSIKGASRCVVLLNLFSYANQSRVNILFDIIATSSSISINATSINGGYNPNGNFTVKIWKNEEAAGEYSFYINTPYGEIINPQCSFVFLLKSGNLKVYNTISPLPESAELITL